MPSSCISFSAVTFVNLLLEVESSYEVHDYIKSFLGETDEVHSFAKEFLEKRQKIVNYKQTTAKGQQVNDNNDYTLNGLINVRGCVGQEVVSCRWRRLYRRRSVYT